MVGGGLFFFLPPKKRNREVGLQFALTWELVFPMKKGKSGEPNQTSPEHADKFAAWFIGPANLSFTHCPPATPTWPSCTISSPPHPPPLTLAADLPRLLTIFFLLLLNLGGSPKTTWWKPRSSCLLNCPVHDLSPPHCLLLQLFLSLLPPDPTPPQPLLSW